MSVEKSKGEEKTEAGVNDLQDGGKITVRTMEEQKYVNMLLDMLRGVNERVRHSLIRDITDSHPHCNHKMSEHETRAKVALTGLDSNEINTLEYGFYYVNGVLATTQRISHENSEGDTEQVPADFYWIVDEARERLDKIRTLLGFIIETDDSEENSAGS